MPDPTAGRGGIILVRLWMEGSDAALRARVIYRPDAITTATEDVAFASTVDELCGLLRERITAFVEQAPLSRPAR
jgi:hypothetical protein